MPPPAKDLFAKHADSDYGISRDAFMGMARENNPEASDYDIARNWD